MCISDDFLPAQEYATEGDRKNKFSNIRDEEDGEIVPDIMIELQRGANSELNRKFPSIDFSYKQINLSPLQGELGTGGRWVHGETEGGM